ncbi:MAG: diaminopimelate decarboxylase family protein, partial [Nitrososphaera sp.]
GVRLGLISDSQFGVEVETGEAVEICRKIAMHPDCFELSCIHFSVASNAKNARLHKKCVLKALEFMIELKREMDISISFLDIGGGFGVLTTKIMSRQEYAMYRLFRCLPKPPSFQNYQPIQPFLSEIIIAIEKFTYKHGLDMPKLLIEPGRYVTSCSEFLLTKVHAIKKNKNGTQFVITDAGRISLAYPCDYEYHEVFLANRPYEKATELYQIIGRVCTPADWMFKNRCLPPLRPGDVLAVMDAGAYFSSYSSNFSFPRPPIVMVSEGGAHVIRNQETFEHLIAMDNLWASRSARTDS